MADILSKEQRSRLMSKVRSADTKPEWILRCGLHRLGFRYRLNDPRLPGRPDMVFPKYRAVVFVHGCFWHQHAACKDASMPKTNRRFWKKKLAGNVKRDARAVEALLEQGWGVLTVWECQLINETVATVQKAAKWLHKQTGAGSRRLRVRSVGGRTELLTAAEKRTRGRITGYDRKIT